MANLKEDSDFAEVYFELRIFSATERFDLSLKDEYFSYKLNRFSGKFYENQVVDLIESDIFKKISGANSNILIKTF